MAELESGRRRLQLALLVVWLFAPAAASGNGPVLEPVSVIRARASALFRAKKFGAACPLFEAAAGRAPEAPEILTDLALCQQRIGSDELARQTNLEAIARASQPGRLDEPRFARVRRHAYFNLGQLEGGGEAEPSVGYDPSCWQLQAAPGCRKSFNACAVARVSGGPAYRSDTTVVRIAQSEDAAGFGDNVPEVSPDFESRATPSDELPVPIDADSALDYAGRFSEEALTYRCEWSCQSSSAVSDEVSKCQSNPKQSASARQDCERTVCARAERAPWAAIKAEQRESDACYQSAATVDGEDDCYVVYANACTGLVGLLCSGHAGGEHETRTRVEEYRFLASKEEPSP